MSADYCRVLRIVLTAAITISLWTTILSAPTSRVPNKVFRKLDSFTNGPISNKLDVPLTEVSKNQKDISDKGRDAAMKKKRSMNTIYRVLRWADHERDVPTEGGGGAPPAPKPAAPSVTIAPAVATTKAPPKPVKLAAGVGN